MVAAQIAAVVRERERTVRRWLVRYQAEGMAGLADAPRSGAPPKVTTAYRGELLAVVRRRPRKVRQHAASDRWHARSCRTSGVG
jgi:transposase